MERLFPLPLTAFERYMVQASWSGDPMLSDCTWQFRGTFDRAAFEQALRRAVDANPLLRCRLEWTAGQVPRWVLTDRSDLDVCWYSLTAPSGWDGDLELSDVPGLRIWIRPLGAGRTALSIHNHHALTDGIGVTRFASLLMHEYAALRAPAGAPRTEWPASDPAALVLRGSLAPQVSWRERVRSAKWLARRGKQPLTALAVPRDRAVEPWTPGELATEVVPPALFAKLRERLRAHKASVNDHLLATLFKTLAAWNERHGTSNPTDRLRVMMPANTRDERHEHMPMANCVGFAIIDRTPADCTDARTLLASVARESRLVRDRHMGVAFVDVLALNDTIARLRGKLVRRKRTRRSSRCVTTSTLSYLGALERMLPQGGPRDEQGRYVFGDVTLLSAWGYPPRQDLTRIVLCANYYCGELSLCANADPTYFDRARAMEFLALYKSLLLAEVVAGESVDATTKSAESVRGSTL